MPWTAQEHAWLFAALFVAIVFWTYRRGAKKRYRHDAEIPLEDDDSRRPSAK